MHILFTPASQGILKNVVECVNQSVNNNKRVITDAQAIHPLNTTHPLLDSLSSPKGVIVHRTNPTVVEPTVFRA